MYPRSLLAGLATTVALTGCASSEPAPEAAPTTTVIDVGVERAADTTTTAVIEELATTTTEGLADGSDGALLATLLVFGGGDVESAIADGLITPDQLEAALAAIETRSLDAILAS